MVQQPVATVIEACEEILQQLPMAALLLNLDERADLRLVAHRAAVQVDQIGMMDGHTYTTANGCGNWHLNSSSTSALANLGHNIARNTVTRILPDHGIDPAPERNQRTPWKTFLRTHWEGLAAADLFTVEVLTLAGLRRYFVFFVIELKTRRVHIAGIHPQPNGRWMEQLARNLTDPVWCNKAAEVGESAKQGRCEWLLPQ